MVLAKINQIEASLNIMLAVAKRIHTMIISMVINLNQIMINNLLAKTYLKIVIDLFMIKMVKRSLLITHQEITAKIDLITFLEIIVKEFFLIILQEIIAIFNMMTMVKVL